MNKDLTEKAIDFKGKKYVLVSDRVLYFNETYKEGSITTELISKPEDDLVVMKATVKPNDKQTFTAYSQATWGEGYINKTSALENAETSAVGRALAFMGIGVIESIASADEINKAQTQPSKPSQKPQNALSNAKQAILEVSDIEELETIEKQIKASTKLTKEEKDGLKEVISLRAKELPPFE
jgi:hypothetical protein